MRELPPGFPIAQLVERLEVDWSLTVREFEYLPLGFGAHHWRVATSDAGDLFLSVHDMDLMGRSSGDRRASLDVLDQALATAHWLAKVAQLDFVLGPLPAQSGAVLRPVTGQFGLHVYPWLEAEELPDADGLETASIVARLHQASSRLPAGLAHVEDFVIPHREALEKALDQLEVPWQTGPYAESARDRLRRTAEVVRSFLAFYDATAHRAIASSPDWVLTHGEPRGPNLLRSTDGARTYLIDWDTVQVAPRERDLWELASTPGALEAYSQSTDAQIDDDRLRLYEAWYALAEIAVYTVVFRSPHTGDANDVLSWENFLRFLPTPERWPELQRFSS